MFVLFYFLQSSKQLYMMPLRSTFAWLLFCVIEREYLLYLFDHSRLTLFSGLQYDMLLIHHVLQNVFSAWKVLNSSL